MFEKIVGVIKGLCLVRGYGLGFATRIVNSIFRYLKRRKIDRRGQDEFVKFVKNGEFDSEDFIRRSPYIGSRAIEVLKDAKAIIDDFGD